jgi:hypothetical protein
MSVPEDAVAIVTSENRGLCCALELELQTQPNNIIEEKLVTIRKIMKSLEGLHDLRLAFRTLSYSFLYLPPYELLI